MTALVLSAGGMFGAWQAGAWLALEGIFRPDIVIGASVGSLNGWLIACGFPAAEIASEWKNMDEMTRLHWRFRGLREGLLDTSLLEARIRKLSEGYAPRIRLGVVCVSLRPPRPVLFQQGEITWRHLAASCAVPGVVAPVLLDGKPYIDGGALGPLPLWAAPKMGASRIIALDVLSPRPLWLRIPQAIVRRLGDHDYKLPATVQYKLIGPQKLLGGWGAAARWNRERSERWIDEGRAAALSVADEIREFLAGA